MSDEDKKNERCGPGRDVSLPVSIPIMVDAGGELHVVDPRGRDSGDVGLFNNVTEPVDWEQRIARMVETALARALPVSLSAPASESGPPVMDNTKQPAPLSSPARSGCPFN